MLMKVFGLSRLQKGRPRKPLSLEMKPKRIHPWKMKRTKRGWLKEADHPFAMAKMDSQVLTAELEDLT
jgi:hypothetical protein